MAADMPEEPTFSCTAPPPMHTEEAKYCIYMYLLMTKGKNFELHKHTPAFKRQQNTSTKEKKMELEAPTQTVESGRKCQQSLIKKGPALQTAAAPPFCSQVHNSESQPEEKNESV